MHFQPRELLTPRTFNPQPLFTPKMCKIEHADGELGEHREHEALEMQPHAAARSQVLHAPGARIT